jgi:hypothetical protein
MDGLIHRIPKKIRNQIKNEFYAVIFILCIIGAVIGYINGKNAAQIGGQPLVTSMNDLFSYARSKEMRDGDFGSLIESNLIAEPQYNDLTKVRFRTREPMHQTFDNILIEPRTTHPLSVANMNIPQGLIEGNYRSERPAGDVGRVDRRPTDSTLPEAVVPNRLAPLETDEFRTIDRSVNRLSQTQDLSRIPNQIDRNLDSLIPLEETSEPEIRNRSIERPSQPQDPSKSRIPEQIDLSSEIIR